MVLFDTCISIVLCIFTFISQAHNGPIYVNNIGPNSERFTYKHTHITKVPNECNDNIKLFTK